MTAEWVQNIVGRVDEQFIAPFILPSQIAGIPRRYHIFGSLQNINMCVFDAYLSHVVRSDKSLCLLDWLWYSSYYSLFVPWRLSKRISEVASKATEAILFRNNPHRYLVCQEQAVLLSLGSLKKAKFPVSARSSSGRRNHLSNTNMIH